MYLKYHRFRPPPPTTSILLFVAQNNFFNRESKNAIQRPDSWATLYKFFQLIVLQTCVAVE